MLTFDDPRLAAALESAYGAFACAEGELTWGPHETAIGAPHPDQKRYFELDDRTASQAPDAVCTLRLILATIVNRRADRIVREWGPLSGSLQELIDSDNGPLLRMSAYSAGPRDTINHPHSDIDLFTVLPAATAPGLEVEIGGEWKPVETAPDQVLLLPGDLIGHFGGPPPIRHRVVSSGLARMSASLFVNANPLLRVGETMIGVMVAERLSQVQG